MGDRAIEESATIALVAAVAANGVIGADGGMPWHYPADLAHFRETTMGYPVILGRRTYESIANRLGGPLPGRTNIVLTRSEFEPEAGESEGEGEDESKSEGEDENATATVVVVGSVDEAVDAAAATGAGTVYVAGGASIYEQFLPRADRLVITEVPESPDGDTYFPEWDREAWREVAREERDELAFVTYERR